MRIQFNDHNKTEFKINEITGFCQSSICTLNIQTSKGATQLEYDGEIMPEDKKILQAYFSGLNSKKIHETVASLIWSMTDDNGKFYPDATDALIILWIAQNCGYNQKHLKDMMSELPYISHTKLLQRLSRLCENGIISFCATSIDLRTLSAEDEALKYICQVKED